MRKVLLSTAGGDEYDVTQLVGPVDFTDNINTPGICKFSILDHELIKLAEGGAVKLYDDDTEYFKGYLFTQDISDKDPAKLTFYDQLRYLKSKDGYVFKNNTATEVARRLFADFGLTAGTLEDTGYRMGSLTFDDKTGLDIVSDCLNYTLRSTQNYFFIRDEAGLAVLRNIKSCLSSLAVSAISNVSGFSYQRGIDEDSYNQVKLARDNAETGKREIYLTKDSGNIAKWGLLQYFEKLDDKTNPEQAKAKADALLGLKNRVQQKLTGVEVQGEKSLRAGNMLYVDIPRTGLKKFLLCTGAKHSFSSVGHIVKADFKAV